MKWPMIIRKKKNALKSFRTYKNSEFLNSLQENCSLIYHSIEKIKEMGEGV